MRLNLNPRTELTPVLSNRLGRPHPDRRQWIIRPDDLLVLDVELKNLRVVPGEGGKPARLAKSGSGLAFLIVTLPPQHLAERAFFTNTETEGYKIQDPGPGNKDPDTDSASETPQAPPIHAVSAGWSRVVFRVPDECLPIPWTLPDLLHAMGTLDMNVPVNALPPPSRPVRVAGTVGAAPGLASLLAGPATSMAPFASLGEMLAEARARRRIRIQSLLLPFDRLAGGEADFLDPVAAVAAAPAVAAAAEGLAPLLRPAPRPPLTIETALELPFELFLAPNRFGAWAHSGAPVVSPGTGHTELWHTRLGVRGYNGQAIETASYLRTLRAVWTTAGFPPAPPPYAGAVDTPPPGGDVRMAMDARDKHNVVHLSSNFQIPDPRNRAGYFEPRPLDVDLLALSSLGAWLDSRGAWDTPPAGLTVEEWRHRASLGRDHYVRIVYRGMLYPWGHRASLVKITERRFEGALPGNPAYLRQRMFIVVREPVRTYRNSGLRYTGPTTAERLQGERFDLMLPFTSARITTLVSPLLDLPECDDVSGLGAGCFWPRVAGQPFKFHLVATDLEANTVELAMPLIFVAKDFLDPLYADKNSVIPQAVPAAYGTTTWPGNGSRRATVPLGGQRVAFAPGAQPDDTTFAVQAMTFGAEVPDADTYDAMTPLEPRFFPVVRSAEIDVPSLQAIARTGEPASMAFSARYLVDGFEGANSGQVFLAAATPPDLDKLAVRFSGQGDRSGALLTPDLDLSGLSRLTGPVSGDLNLASAGTFAPEAWFGAIASAKLFGVLPLFSILETVGLGELGKVPKFTGQVLNPVERLLSDLARLRRLLDDEPVPATGLARQLLEQLAARGTGSIARLLHGGAIGDVLAQLRALGDALQALPGAMAASGLPPGVQTASLQAAASLQREIAAMTAAPAALQRFANGDQLPAAVQGRLEWRPQVKETPIFKPGGDRRNLLLAVDAAGDSFVVTCSLDDFALDLEFLVLEFRQVQFRSLAGKKPEVDVAFTSFTFSGPLAFVETLRSLIPFEGFSKGPRIDVSPEGISAGFSMGLPNIAMGVFSLENLALSAGFALPFSGKPMSIWFRFCERENPSRLTIALFGGGFYVGLTLNADGLQVVEGAIEFGASVSVDLGVAAGGVSIMAGLYFKMESDELTLAGYFRMRGIVRALGIVTVSLELYLEMRFESGSGKCIGTATVSLEIEVALFSTTISVTCSKKFAGSKSDPTLADLLDVGPDATSADWNAYCAAFA